MEGVGVCGWRSGVSCEDVSRFGRQLVLVGTAAQCALQSSRVLVVGCGGLGSGCVPALCAAGIKAIGLADGDTVEESNLPRQTMHGEV